MIISTISKNQGRKGGRVRRREKGREKKRLKGKKINLKLSTRSIDSQISYQHVPNNIILKWLERKVLITHSPKHKTVYPESDFYKLNKNEISTQKQMPQNWKNSLWNDCHSCVVVLNKACRVIFLRLGNWNNLLFYMYKYIVLISSLNWNWYNIMNWDCLQIISGFRQFTASLLH